MNSTSKTYNSKPSAKATLAQPTLLMAGGTGGHIFPALALANHLQEQGHPVAWLGSSNSMEAAQIPPTGIPFYALSISGLRGKGWRTLAVAPWRLLTSLLQALRILRQVKPAQVIGFGGFASGPGGLAAWLLRIPVYIHEQNALPGLTNKSLAKLAQQVFTAFPQAFAGNPKVQLVGNPVRQNLLHLPAPVERYSKRTGPLRILVMGGSQGAAVLNSTLPATLNLLHQAQAPLPLIRHQAGNNNLTNTQALYAQYPDLAQQVEVTSFIADMAAALAWADLVICRAGALTVAEISVVGVAAILVPFPFAVDDHQTHNAQFLAQAGAALVVPQPQFTPAALAELITEQLSQRHQLEHMATQAHRLAARQASQLMYNAIFKES